MYILTYVLHASRQELEHKYHPNHAKIERAKNDYMFAHHHTMHHQVGIALLVVTILAQVSLV